MHRMRRMLLVTAAALGVDSIVVAAIVGSLLLARALHAGNDAVFDTTLGIAIAFVTTAWLLALATRGWRQLDRAPAVHPPDFLT
jgi:hypothetical protein